MSEVEKIDEEIEKTKKKWLDILFKNDSKNLTQFNEALAYVRQNFMEHYYYENHFLQLEIETFCKLFESDDLNVPNEEVVFECIRRWLDFNEISPNSELKRLLKVVRLPLLPIKYLFDEVEPYVYRIETCKEEFLNTLRYHYLEENENKINFRKFQNLPLKTD